MAKHFGKKQSKRISCKKRYKIEKNVRQHNKKMKKKSEGGLRKSKKDPGVPNRCPFKEQVLKEAENRKTQIEEERLKQKERRKMERQKLVSEKRNLSGLVKDAQKRNADFDRQEQFVSAVKSKEFNGGKAVETSLKTYYREVKKVIDAADVIIEVLDARDPLGSRCPQVEEAVLGAGPNKKLVLLLNKIDLVPKENVENWLKYLRNELPTVAFKACTQSQADNLGRSKVPLSLASDSLRKSSQCLGAEMLMTLLANYCRSQDIKTAITIGLVGFPNTGKSSVINSLKRSRACNVGATPGVTKAMQLVQLDKHIKLLDSPGIVMTNSTSDTAVILRNCVKLESLADPVTPVSAILARCSKEQMMMHYGLPDFSTVTEFLALLAKRYGKLRKGGVPDSNKAAKLVLQDWNTGKITYYTQPPETHTMASHLSAEIVSELGKQFVIDDLLKDEETTLRDLKPVSSQDIVVVSEGPTAGLVAEAGHNDMCDVNETGHNVDDDDEYTSCSEENSEEEEMDEIQSVPSDNMTVELESRSRTPVPIGKATRHPVAMDTNPVLPGNQQLNSLRKKDFKKVKKQRKRSDKLAGTLSTALCSSLAGLGDDYSFETDFV